MNAVEITRAFHTLDDAGRAAVMAGDKDAPKGSLAVEIAALPEAEREGVLAAIAHDFDTSGKLKETAGLSPDERVAQTLPSHPFRSSASIPDGIKLDAAGLASEIEIPPADAAEKASLSGVPHGARGAAPVVTNKPDLNAMTIDELRVMADKKHVDLTGLTLKSDIIAAIEKK